MTDILLVVLIIAIVVASILLVLNLRELRMKRTSSKHLSLGGLSDSLDPDKDVIEKLNASEAEDKLDKQQKEVLQLMTNNREQQQYKNALNATISTIKAGKPVGQPTKKESVNG